MRSAVVFRRKLLRWYERNGRHELPWRTRAGPYLAVVSEFMLQQTQAVRVGPLLERFVDRFPDFAALAQASTADVVRAWKGLGYNQRAVRLKSLAQAVIERHGGRLPRDAAELRALPGVGPYTAAAIRAFVYDLDDAPVDTNVRRVLSRAFGLDAGGAAALRELALELVPPGRARDWSSALMDLGATVCTARAPDCPACPVQNACVSAGKPPAGASLKRAGVRFVHTTRYARGRIVDRLRELEPGASLTIVQLHRALDAQLQGRSRSELDLLVAGLERDGLVARRGGRVRLAE